MYRAALFEKNKIHPNGFEFERNYHTLDELIDDWGLEGDIVTIIKIAMAAPCKPYEYNNNITVQVGREYASESRPIDGWLHITKLYPIKPKF